jgi:quercetin dioxygenase-like cupin family protein
MENKRMKTLRNLPGTDATKRRYPLLTAKKSLPAAGSLLLSLSLFSLSPTVHSEDWVPVYKEPKHRLAFENSQAMILNVELPPGYVSLYHKHQLDTLYVTISGTQVWAQPMGGEKRNADVKTGDLRFSSDNHGLPHIHRVGNVGAAPFHVIAVGIKSDIAGDVTPIEGDTTGLQLVDEKPHARVYRISLKPGEKTGLHRHKLPFTQVYLSAGKLSSGGDKPDSVNAGEFLWQEAGLSHHFENAGNETIEIIEVQAR